MSWELLSVAVANARVNAAWCVCDGYVCYGYVCDGVCEGCVHVMCVCVCDGCV